MEVSPLSAGVEQLVEGHQLEVGIHQLHAGAQTCHGGTNGAAHDGTLRNWSTDAALGAELVQDPLGRAEDAAHFRHILAVNKNGVVSAHFLTDRGTDRLCKTLFHNSPSVSDLSI